MNINYNKSKNELIISDDQKPVAGITGPMSKTVANKLLKKHIERLRENADNLNAWLFNKKNFNNPKWAEKKELYNSIMRKVKCYQAKLRKDQFKKHRGLNEISVPKKV